MKQATKIKRANAKPVTKKLANAELRQHYFMDRYVIIAPKRNLRPDSMAHQNPSHTTETPTSPPIEQDTPVFQVTDDDGKWLVKVINNKFPALTLDNPKAFGKQEVVIETPEHNREFSSLSLEQVERVFSAYIDRSTKLSKVKGIRYVSVFKNDGPNAGASISHAHSQIIALPIIPPLVEHESFAQQAYMDEHDACPYCDIIAWEEQQKVRIIYEDKNIVAIAPYASQNPFEAWVLPREHRTSFASLTLDERHSTAVALKQIAGFLDNSRISFNFFLQDALKPFEHHFVLRVEPRQTIWAGLELSTGVIINPLPPEEAALWYRGKLK
jgi:UDPglucose--hexose-1-phosphate uridylyltransferase